MRHTGRVVTRTMFLRKTSGKSTSIRRRRLSRPISAACGARSIRFREAPIHRCAARAIGSVKTPRFIRTSSFRSAALYAGLFARIDRHAPFGIVYWTTTNALRDKFDRRSRTRWHRSSEVCDGAARQTFDRDRSNASLPESDSLSTTAVKTRLGRSSQATLRISACSKDGARRWSMMKRTRTRRNGGRTLGPRAFLHWGARLPSGEY